MINIIKIADINILDLPLEDWPRLLLILIIFIPEVLIRRARQENYLQENLSKIYVSIICQAVLGGLVFAFWGIMQSLAVPLTHPVFVIGFIILSGLATLIGYVFRNSIQL